MLVHGRFSALKWVLIGFAPYAFTRIFAHAQRFEFIETFEHEVGHGCLAFLFGGNVYGFNVVAEEDKPGYGEVQATGCSPLVAVAPYAIPVLTMPLLAIRYWLGPDHSMVVDLLIGGTLSVHYVRVLVDLVSRPEGSASDISKVGILFTAIVSAGLNTVCLIVIICFVQDEPALILNYLRSSLELANHFYAIAFGWIRQWL